LADDFLRDFGAPEEEENLEAREEGDEDEDSRMPGIEEEALADSFHRKAGAQDDLDEATLKTLTQVSSVYEIAKIFQGDELPRLLADIEEQRRIKGEDAANGADVNRILEEDPEYEVITRGNDMIHRIGQEITVIHRYIQDIYRNRWPELETLVPNPMDYVRCVNKLGNNLQLARAELADLLPSASIISLSVAATTTSGKPLNEAELAKVNESCVIVFKLDESRQRVIQYIESRMKFYAPNLSALIGSSIASKLISIAGGLTALGRMVSGNLQALGISKKGSLNGMSTRTSLGHVGYIIESDLIQNCPQSLFKQAYRLVSGKCMIAARCDSFHTSPHGQVGATLREEIERKIEKWQEPPPARLEKALPLPEWKKGKHRAGRKVQAKKASYAMTELRKRANRLQFGQITEEHGNEPDRDLGMLSQDGHGLLRIASNLENKGFKIKAIKEQRTKGTSKNSQASSSSSTGPQASTVLTSGAAKTSGLRTIVRASEAATQNPLQARLDALKSSNAGYFSSIGGFSTVVKKD
jgi:U4/U6 small nuclear ribonucleoprotein PRP31